MALDFLPEVTPNSFATVDEAMAYIGRAKGGEEDAEFFARVCLNAVADRFELETGRRLCGRVYRTASALTGSMTAGTAIVTGLSSTSGLYEFDAATHASLPAGARIQSVDSATQVTLTKECTAAISSGSITFGSEALVANGRNEFTTEGYWKLQCPEHPIHALYSVKSRDSSGALTSVTTTGYRLDTGTGLIILPQASALYGEQNIEIECLAGYLPPAAGSRRGFDGWHALKQLTLRAVEVLFQDWQQHHGRSGDLSVVNVTSRVYSFDWPDDIKRGLSGFGRRW